MTVEATRPFLLICAPAAHAEHMHRACDGPAFEFTGHVVDSDFPLQTLVGSYSTAWSQKVQVERLQLYASCVRPSSLRCAALAAIDSAAACAFECAFWQLVACSLRTYSFADHAHPLRAWLTLGIWPPPHHAQDEEGLESEVPARGAYTACPPAAPRRTVRAFFTERKP